MLSQELLEILACPKCKGELEYKIEPHQFICHSCRLIYKVEDDIPNFLIEEAESF
ncbi:MAG: Trm112 family protein [bacterium]